MPMILGECPKCRIQMSEFPLSPRLSVEFCSQCKGMWLDRGVLGKSVGSDQDFPGSNGPGDRGVLTELACVRCGNGRKLERVRYTPANSLEIEFCRTCSGIFLDFKELPAVQTLLKQAPARAPVQGVKSAVKGAAPGLERPSLKESFSPEVLKQEISPWMVRIFWNPKFILSSSIGVLVSLPFVFMHGAFLLRAVATQGTVLAVETTNARCGSSRRHHDCTKFKATIEFLTREQVKQTAELSAGTVRGHGRSLSSADFQPDTSIPILYDPRNLTEISHDTFLKGWGWFIGAFGVYLLLAVNFRAAKRHHGGW